MKAAGMALLVSGLTLLVSAGLAGQQRDRKGRVFTYAELGKAPDKARKRINPLEADPDAVTAGGLLFEDHCAQCHGEKALGGRKGPSLLAPEVQNATPGTLYWLLTNGSVWRGMPVWSRLPEQERWQLVRFIKSLGPKKPAPEAPDSDGAKKP